jgi:KaiC/GvpD/RAD55 family RecA-like ATPase
MEITKFKEVFKDSYILTFDDEKKGRFGYTLQFPMSDFDSKYDFLKEKNAAGAGIFFTPNPCKNGRKEKDVISIQWVYVDMDNASKPEQLEKIKKAPIQPGMIIESKRSYHLYWNVECTDAQFKSIINGLLDFFDGDPAISSKNEVLRFPGFYHVKDPIDKFLVKIIKFDFIKESPEDMIQAFPYTPPMEKFVKKHNLKNDDISIIKDIPIKQVLDKLGVQLTPTHFIIENGQTTSASVNVKENYINRFSGKPGSGSTIDAVMIYGKKDLKEAIEWLKEMAGIKKKIDIKKILTPEYSGKDVISLVEDIPYTWGTEVLDNELSPLQRGEITILVGGTGTGKTAFCFDVAIKNAHNGHKVLFLSLEMTADEILTRISRSYAGIRKNEWRDKRMIPDYKKELYREKKNEIKEIKTLLLTGFPKDIETTLDNIFKVVSEYNPDLLFIDNFDLIHKDDNKEYVEQNRISKMLSQIAKEINIPIVVLHHFGKIGDKEKKANPLEVMRGSAKIAHNADNVFACFRTYSQDATIEENAKFMIVQPKDRGFGQWAETTVFFNRGTFKDEFEEKKVELWQDSI